MALAQVRPDRIRVASGVMKDLLIKKVPPEYPANAGQPRGDVLLNIVIDQQGNVVRVRLISGHPEFAPAAIDAVKQWKYKPYLLNGVPFKVETSVVVNFKPDDHLPTGVVGDQPGGIPPEEVGGIAPSTGSTEPIPPMSATPNRVRIASSITQKRLIFAAAPEYPAEAKAKHIEGQVILKIIIDKQGRVANAELISGHPILAPAAINAVKQWKYEPYLLNNKPVEVETRATVTFSLKP